MCVCVNGQLPDGRIGQYLKKAIRQAAAWADAQATLFLPGENTRLQTVTAALKWRRRKGGVFAVKAA